jgi:protein phosphatase
MIGSPAWFSEVGTRDSNEDSCAFWWAGGTLYAAIADGLGGMGGGGCASSYVLGWLKARATSGAVSARQLAILIRRSHRGLRQLQRRWPENRSMATTLTVIALRGRRLVAAHCGDTRLYVAGRDGVRQLTEDHSEAQRLFNAGLLSRSEFANYPRKHILESAIGIPRAPMVQEIDCRLNAGDWLVLASDGAYGKLGSGDLGRIARGSCTPRQFSDACRRLVEARQPRDNYTLVVVRAMGDRVPPVVRRVLQWRAAGGNV